MASSQLRKGVLELIVLSTLERQSSYGGEILERLDNEAGMQVSAGTLYPLLTRLKKSGFIDSHWEESPSGPPRKVYDMTPKGRKRMSQLAAEWRSLASMVEKQLKGLGQ